MATRGPFVCGIDSVTCLAILWCALATPVRAQPRAPRIPSGRRAPISLPTSTPEAQGMDSIRLGEAIDFLNVHRDDYRIHRVVVLRHGHLVLDAVFYPFTVGQRHDLASVTKSFTSTLIGIAIDMGYIAGVDEPILDFFSDRTIANLDDRKRAITIENLLTMRTGLDCDSGNHEQILRDMEQTPDWVQFTLDLPMVDEPGASRMYCSPGVHLLSAILERATGMSTVEFARRHLFWPLNISSSLWLVDPDGTARGWGDLHLSTLDMAKLGQLFLDGGLYADRQVVSSWWIRRATAADGEPFPPGWLDDNGYGYLWWSTPHSFSAQGRGGQVLFVFPDDDVVLALNAGGSLTSGGRDGDVVVELRDALIRDAVRSDVALPPDAEALAFLQQRLDAAAMSDEGPPQPVPDLPEVASQISGRTYVLEANRFGFSTLRLSFSPDSTEAIVATLIPPILGDSELQIVIGLDGVSRFSPGLYGMTVAAKGWWESDDTFIALVDNIGLINLWRYGITFADDRVELTIDCLAGYQPSLTIIGTATEPGVKN
jgi:CubicO group peptidase (beta-lactamase class C family)